MAEAIDLTGQTFGFLVAVKPLGPSPMGHGVVWEFKCACGGATTNTVAGIRRYEKQGIKSHCGCMTIGRTTLPGRKGIRAHVLYDVWKRMRARCERPSVAEYPNYGGRGIYVCDRWQSYEHFYSDVVGHWALGLTIDRIDNDGPYAPGNFRFATRAAQNRNRRDNHEIDTPKGRMTITDAAREFDLSEKTLRSRVLKGWSQDRILQRPQSAGARSRRRKD